MRQYIHPEVLVSTKWVSDNINDPNVRIVESDEDVLLYETGHVPNAVKIDWQLDLQDPIRRDYVGQERFEQLLSQKGISNDTKVIFYGDKSNWWACYAFWTFKLFGHENCLVMNGGRQKWLEENRKITKDIPLFQKTKYCVGKINEKTIRAFREDVILHVEKNKSLIDVRSPDEYTGKLLHMENYPQEGALRGGHIPGAKNVPWARAANADGTFKSADELKEIYETEVELKPDDEVIAYCRIGERSSHTWFVLTFLLGYKNVRNYDGSWTEWGNLVRAPVERP
ncbi:MAG: thiosulfate sulfurtransferase [Ignavibacteria bacterium RIFOXYB2_FULL_35_12]|nr:MAG: thiosulfate sulfurtransferase [Ignavibacteria bacterium GWF2_35_20]OGU81187.1 MAG: thiosulfate sulfurtransferase [Ignavibacteria bacterium RIFOXYA2_FULL_35_9]OGU87950.1 MAG: thiosulfate sulfurtransferase [Ignavibacteria bacterium RIFOXYA12_FULL_35_25]OGU96401.1 MAG: thiosulfate sulfurtransferase [Ignavibacteria bacterium RIFOXYB12_FULL_35_14]OGV02582.1 MAG: thiosulfate sulfurtransferase [Ignavibacteria bacterium RIFOXYB2_FULL_35_12]OGV31564.1 MAG: thiosulfate sulfurtransferase [Ignavib